MQSQIGRGYVPILGSLENGNHHHVGSLIYTDYEKPVGEQPLLKKWEYTENRISNIFLGWKRGGISTEVMRPE